MTSGLPDQARPRRVMANPVDLAKDRTQERQLMLKLGGGEAETVSVP